MARAAACHGLKRQALGRSGNIVTVDIVPPISPARRGVTASDGAARAPCKNGADQLEKMQCVLAWHFAF
jgi:hypothetical protein